VWSKRRRPPLTSYRLGNHTTAIAWAKKHGKKTIELTEGGIWLESLDLYNNPLLPGASRCDGLSPGEEKGTRDTSHGNQSFDPCGYESHPGRLAGHLEASLAS
jgi:hypothetical protein